MLVLILAVLIALITVIVAASKNRFKNNTSKIDSSEPVSNVSDIESEQNSQAPSTFVTPTGVTLEEYLKIKNLNPDTDMYGDDRAKQ